MLRFVVLLFSMAAFLIGCGSKSVTDQASLLGTADFTTEGWANGSPVDRGAMVASLLRKHRVVGAAREDVLGLLGPPTAYYQYDEDAAYIVGPSSREGGLLLVFVTDKRTGRIREVVFVPAGRGQD